MAEDEHLKFFNTAPMKVIGVIPARWQSSRFPGKPLANLLGKSLIRRTYENSLHSKSLSQVYIATDDERIFHHAQEFGAPVVMTSPLCATGTDRVWEAVVKCGHDSDVIVNIQGDEPCLNPAVIDALIHKLATTPEAVLTTPVAKIQDPHAAINPSIVKCVFDRSGRALYFSRAAIPFVQKGKKPIDYYRHLGVYCFKRAFLQKYIALEHTPLQDCEDLEQLKILESGFPIHVCIVEDQAHGVDTPEDLKKIEEFLCHKESISL